MGYFYLKCQNLIKTSNNVLFFAPTSLIFHSKLLECNFVIIKIKLINFINATFFMKKFKDSSINSTKSGDLSYYKYMSSYRTLFILFMVQIWKKWTNIAIFVKSFLIIMCSGTHFLNFFLEHLKTCFKLSKSQKITTILIKKSNYIIIKRNILNKLFCKCNGRHSK
jgi:hypothetical protein